MGMNEYLLLAEFDFKKLLVNDDKGYIEQLVGKEMENKTSEENSIKRWLDYKYGDGKVDLDDTKLDYPCWHMRAVYNILWGSKELCDYKNGWGKFRSTFIFDVDKDEKQLLMGGDCMNTIAQPIEHYLGIICEKKYANGDEKYTELTEVLNKNGFSKICKIGHYLGNFCLVPAYFNKWRGLKGNKIYDYWDRSLLELKHFKSKDSKLKDKYDSEFCFEDKILLNNSKTITSEEAKKQFRGLIKEEFTRYINTMFLWDYVGIEKDESGKDAYRIKSIIKCDWSKDDINAIYLQEDSMDTSYKIEKSKSTEKDNFLNNFERVVKRRGIFMAAMLNIAIEFDQGTSNTKQDWNDWQVSDIYKEIMDKVFLADNCYSGFNKVFEAIEKVVPTETEENERVIEILKEAEESI